MSENAERVERVYIDRNLIPEGKRDQIEEERKQIEEGSRMESTPLKNLDRQAF